jgi:hypothetical protein
MNHHEELIIKYFDQELTSQELIEFNHLSETDSGFTAMYNQYADIHNAMDHLQLEQPSPNLLARFNTSLTNEIKHTKHSSKFNIRSIKYLAYAASVALLLAIGASLFSNQSNIPLNSNPSALNATNKNELLVGLNDQATTTRIEAVNNITKEKNTDKDILKAMIHILENDKSPNVRLAAVEALSQYDLSSQVKDAMLRRLTKESDDFVKISLIQALAKVKDSRAIDQYDQLINNQETPKYIRDEAQLAKLKLDVL